MLSPPIEKPASAPVRPPVLRGKFDGGLARGARDEAGLRPRIAIGALDDPLEREADRAADAALAGGAAADFSRIPVTVQRRADAPAAGEAPLAVHRVLAGPGRPLEPALRADFEGRFGRDFSQVRVHGGAAAERSAAEVGALAYTVGRDIVFGAGGFAPEAPAGRRLIAHELSHVVQQEAAAPRLQRQPLGAAAAETPPPFESFRQSLTLPGFESGSAALQPDHLAQLTEYKGRLQILLGRYPDTFVTVIGHTDATDSAANNRALGQQRAEAVVAVLVAGDFPLPASAVTAASLGEAALAVDSPGREPRNRRVEILPTLRRSFGPALRAPERPVPEPPQQPVDVWGPGFIRKGPPEPGPLDLPKGHDTGPRPPRTAPSAPFAPTPPPIGGPAPRNRIEDAVNRTPGIRKLPGWMKEKIVGGIQEGAWAGVKETVDQAPWSGGEKDVAKAFLQIIFNAVLKGQDPLSSPAPPAESPLRTPEFRGGDR